VTDDRIIITKIIIKMMTIRSSIYNMISLHTMTMLLWWHTVIVAAAAAAASAASAAVVDVADVVDVVDVAVDTVELLLQLELEHYEEEVMVMQKIVVIVVVVVDVDDVDDADDDDEAEADADADAESVADVVLVASELFVAGEDLIEPFVAAEAADNNLLG
jgi:hypothetical protein